MRHRNCPSTMPPAASRRAICAVRAKGEEQRVFQPIHSLGGRQRKFLIAATLTAPFEMHHRFPSGNYGAGRGQGLALGANLSGDGGEKRSGLRASQSSVAVKTTGIYPRPRAISFALSQSSWTFPVTQVVMLESVFGVSIARLFSISGVISTPYLRTIFKAFSLVDASGYAGPEAMASSGSPMISLRMTFITFAGMAARANLPPFTLEMCLRIAFISVMLAPLESNFFVSFIKSSSVTPSGKASNSAGSAPGNQKNHPVFRLQFVGEPQRLLRGGQAVGHPGPDVPPHKWSFSGSGLRNDGIL